MINLNCPYCNQLLQIPDEYAEQTGACKYCQNKFTVPALAAQTEKHYWLPYVICGVVFFMIGLYFFLPHGRSGSHQGQNIANNSDNGAELQYGSVRTQKLQIGPAPTDNPLKGLMPNYTGDLRAIFPHSIEYRYLPLSELVIAKKRYDWAPLDKLLREVSGRGHQFAFRVYTSFPNKPVSVPQYLVDDGLEMNHTRTPTPDHDDPRFRECLKDFIHALGKRYDGDPRIAYIEAGLLGYWGEWHTHPQPKLWANNRVQSEVMEAYDAAFQTTHILLRYPANVFNSKLAGNDKRPFGYHDDSFAWSTIKRGNKSDTWAFITLMDKAGEGALNKWEHHPIGGEIRPEAFGVSHDKNPDHPMVQNIFDCVDATHASWIRDNGTFNDKYITPERHQRAKELVDRMGYKFHVPSVTITRNDTMLNVTIHVLNLGVAPFYYDWPVELAVLKTGGIPDFVHETTGLLKAVLPSDSPSTWSIDMDLKKMDPGQYHIVLRIPNPMPSGHPVRFANQEQDQHADEWLSLIPIKW